MSFVPLTKFDLASSKLFQVGLHLDEELAQNFVICCIEPGVHANI